MRKSSRASSVQTLLAGALVAWLTSAAGAGSIVYVDDDAPAGGDGTSWATAFRFLQDGLAFAAMPEHGVTEVRVGQGVYKPDRSEASIAGTGSIQQSFNLVSGVAHKGGYRGLTGGGNPDDRNASLFVAVLSGDLDSDDAPGSFTFDDQNSRHVVRANSTTIQTTLDGVTVTSGCADDYNPLSEAFGKDWEDDYGGGLLVFFGDVTINECVFVGNLAALEGGGIAAFESNCTVVSCNFVLERFQ